MIPITRRKEADKKLNLFLSQSLRQNCSSRFFAAARVTVVVFYILCFLQLEVQLFSVSHKLSRGRNTPTASTCGDTSVMEQGQFLRKVQIRIVLIVFPEESSTRRCTLRINWDSVSSTEHWFL